MGKYRPIIVTADCGSLTRAGKILGYAQPNMGSIVTRFENELGVKLFTRSKHGVTLTKTGEKLVDIMNGAINSTLSRTLLTSGSTIAALISLLALGGPSMWDFSITMLLGIFIGTYSSIYIASPVVLYFDKRGDLRKELQEAEDAAGA